MVITVNVKSDKIFGIIKSEDYNIEYTQDAYNKLKGYLDRYNNCESLDEVKDVLNEAYTFIDSCNSDGIGEFLTCSKTGKLYIKGDKKLSPFAIPDNIAKLIYKNIDSKRSYDYIIKFLLRVLQSNYLTKNTFGKLDEMFGIYSEEYNEDTMDIVTVRKYHFCITKSGLIACNSTNSKIPVCASYPTIAVRPNFIGVRFPEMSVDDFRLYGKDYEQIEYKPTNILSPCNYSDFELSGLLVDDVIKHAEKRLASYRPNVKMLWFDKSNGYVIYKNAWMHQKVVPYRKNEVGTNLKQEILGTKW